MSEDVGLSAAGFMTEAYTDFGMRCLDKNRVMLAKIQ